MESYKKPSKASFLDSDVTRAATTKSTGCFKHIFKAQQTVTTVEEENQRYKAIPSGYRMATDRSFDAIDEHLKDKKKDHALPEDCALISPQYDPDADYQLTFSYREPLANDESQAFTTTTIATIEGDALTYWLLHLHAEYALNRIQFKENEQIKAPADGKKLSEADIKTIMTYIPDGRAELEAELDKIALFIKDQLTKRVLTLSRKQTQTAEPRDSSPTQLPLPHHLCTVSLLRNVRVFSSSHELG